MTTEFSDIFNADPRICQEMTATYSTIFEAAEQGTVEDVKDFVEKGSNVNMKTNTKIKLNIFFIVK